MSQRCRQTGAAGVSRHRAAQRLTHDVAHCLTADLARVRELKRELKREGDLRSGFFDFRSGRLEATPGFEPGIRALQAPALPLGHVAVCCAIAAPVSRRSATRASCCAHRADLGGSMERTKGFEPSTPTLARWCSTTELRPRAGGSVPGGMEGCKKETGRSDACAAIGSTSSRQGGWRERRDLVTIPFAALFAAHTGD